MAKRQNLSLNPSKISGQCGRLLCCLAYEDPRFTVPPPRPVAGPLAAGILAAQEERSRNRIAGDLR
jgi:hypothetical protein